MSFRHLVLKIEKIMRAKGIGGLCAAIIRRIIPVQCRTLSIIQDLLRNQNGIEIGGPSWIFSRKGSLPVYPLVAALDNCNFGSETVWEGAIDEGHTFYYDKEKPAGRQYICEAVDLTTISSSAYDFVLSCHTIEHIANPIRALKEWMRILQKNGMLLLIVPHMEGTFDHRRPVTELKHLVMDFQMDVGEGDLTHLQEVLELHDLDRDLGTTDFNAFKERSENNIQFRCLHHHVFDTNLVLNLLNYVGLQILTVEAIHPFHIIVAAQKISNGAMPQNQPFLSISADWRKNSPFKRDRMN